jgi:acetyl esterase/lipase
VAVGLVLVLSLASAGAALLIVLPAPSAKAALAAIVASERSAFLLVGGLLAVALAAAGWAPKTRLVAAIAGLLGLLAAGISALPLVQARGVARARGVALDFGRYLRAFIDTEGPGRPDRSIPYAPGLSMDVYLPKPPPAAGAPSRPVIVLHGGFWRAGQVGEGAGQSRRLADRGFTVFDVGYRIAPQPNWQTGVGDVKCAIGWVKAHATTPDWNVDAGKLAVLGRSAGAHLALMAAYAPDDPTLAPACPAPDTSVEAVIALYPPTDLAWFYDHPANARAADNAVIRNFLGGPPSELAQRYRALSPADRVTSRSPRTLVLHGGRDQFIPAEQSQRLVERLRAAGVAHDAVFIPWAQHAFDFVVGGYSSQLFEAALLRFLQR